MTKNFHERFQVDAPPPPSARSTGWVFTVVALVVAYWFRANATAMWVALCAGAAFAASSTFAPTLLEPLNRVWFQFALLLNKIVSPIVMGLMFALAIVPFGLIMQRMRDPLRSARRPDLETYWLTLEPAAAVERDMRNQF